MGDRLEEQRAIARRLYGPQPEGRILNTMHVREEPEPPDSIANQVRNFKRLA